MKVLILNGSPRSSRSNTMHLSNSFVDGMGEKTAIELETVHIYDKNIQACRGCYVCWTKTPGTCAVKDDMQQLLAQFLQADVVIWSFPLYYYGMPSGIKAFMDRLLPINLPFIKLNKDNVSTHTPRYDLQNQRHVLISTAGLGKVEGNYDALLRQFEILFPQGYEKILCTEGELFSVKQLKERTSEYLSYVKLAGREYASTGITEGTHRLLQEHLFDYKAYTQMADASWDIRNEASAVPPQGVKLCGRTEEAYSEKAAESGGRRFMKQMAALYNPAFYERDVLLEMNFTDTEEHFQLLLGKEKCSLLKDKSDSEPDTTIHTPLEVWKKISEGELIGSEAMMKGLYRIDGDFNVMLKMDDFFGTAPKAEQKSEDKRHYANMNIFLLPFYALWFITPINQQLGAALAILAAAFVSVLHYRWRPTPYEPVSQMAVSVIALFLIFYGDLLWRSSLIYLTFGCIWIVSVFRPIPLCAYYSSKGYGGEIAYQNPLFMRTNRILAAMWGIGSLLIGIAGFFTPANLAGYWPILVNVPTILMGVFTGWFQHWYPAKVARG